MAGRMIGSVPNCLVMMMLMFFDQVPELIPADGLLRWMDLSPGPGKYFFGPDAVNRVLDELPVLHHPLHIIGYPGLFLSARLHSHIAEQLLPRKGPDIVLAHLNMIVADDLFHDQCPLQLINESREFDLDFGRA